jgi:hypothetical protein
MNGVVGETGEHLISAAKKFLQRSRENPEEQSQRVHDEKRWHFQAS